MSKRSLTWLRQHTNVEDLLDDGIENNSDLKSFAISEQAPDDLPVAKPANTALPKSQIVESRPTPAEPDFYVAAIAVLIIACGAGLIFYPVDTIVYHSRAVEHVTAGRSELYGVAGVLCGLALLAYSFYKPRK